MRKGGNAVEATREQPLGRASNRSIGCRFAEVKGVVVTAPNNGVHLTRFARR